MIKFVKRQTNVRKQRFFLVFRLVSINEPRVSSVGTVGARQSLVSKSGEAYRKPKLNVLLHRIIQLSQTSSFSEYFLRKYMRFVFDMCFRRIQNSVVSPSCQVLLRIHRAHLFCLPARALLYSDSIAHRGRNLRLPSVRAGEPSGASKHRRSRDAVTSGNYVKERFGEFVDTTTAHSGQLIVVTSHSSREQPVTDVRVPRPTELAAKASEREGAVALCAPVLPVSQPTKESRTRLSAYQCIDEPS